MSSGSQEKHAEAIEELTRELRQFNELGASFLRATAAQVGMAITDIQLLDLLDLVGPLSAGQLAELTGLTTGAITRILDRLEETGLVQRVRDPNDGRKVVVRLARDKDNLHKVRSMLDSVGKAWGEVASRYDDEQIAFLLSFLKHSNALSRQELVQLQQEAPSGGGEFYSAPLGDQESSRLVISCGISRLNLRAHEKMAELYQARFEGPIPGVKMKDEVLTIRYPRRLLGLGEKQGMADIALSTVILWQIVIQGGAAEVAAELGNLHLSGLEVTGGFHMIHLALPTPSSMVPIKIRGGAAEITIVRPAGVAVRVRLNGWVSELIIDDQAYNGVGNNRRLQSPGFDPMAPYYDIEATSYASKVTITSA